MGQSELIETDILYVFLSLALTLPFIKSLGAEIDGDNSVEILYGEWSTPHFLHQKSVILIILLIEKIETLSLECFFLHDWKLLWFIYIA